MDVINRAFENHVDVLKVLDWNEVIDKLISVYKMKSLPGSTRLFMTI